MVRCTSLVRIAYCIKLPIILQILSGNGNTLNTEKLRVQKRKNNVDRHGLRPLLNNLHLAGTPYFSLYSTFKLLDTLLASQ